MIRSFYKYARNQYLGDSLNNFMWVIDINYYYMDININQKIKYYYANQNTKE